ncbi:MAG: hypothetical protein ACK40C_08420 [Novosphingobium meiothermophilum]
MMPPPLPLCAVPWTAGLACALADASAAVARLDARITASSLTPAWLLRASWMGYGVALRLQKFEIDEIDIIAHECGLRLAGRPRLETVADPFSALDAWRARLGEGDGRHWREDLPFTFTPPEGWSEAPALVRALTLLDEWARRDGSIAPWLAFPVILRRMGLSARALPCLAMGDAAQRFAQEPRAALLKRLLRQVRHNAEEGLVRLDRLENAVRRSAGAIAAEHRPGKLAELARIALARPCLAPRSVAPLLDLTLSGAGKLLTRASRLGLMVETSGRGTWRSYVMSDVAAAFGLALPARGRPRNPPAPSPALDALLAAFDAEMAAIDARLRQRGIET